MQNPCLMGTGFPFRVSRKFWNQPVVTVAQHVHAPNATELFPLK